MSDPETGCGLEADTVQPTEEVVMPPGPAVLAVGDRLEADRLLLGDDLPDLGVLDRRQLLGGDAAGLALGAGLLQRRRAQDGADVIGTEWHIGRGHG